MQTLLPFPINRLFAKLWLTFWLTLLVFLCMVLMAAAMYIQNIQDRYNYVVPIQRLEQLMLQAQDEMKWGGMPALLTWLRQIDEEELVPLLLVDDNHQDILGRTIDPNTLDYIKSYDQDDYPERPMIHVADGVNYRFYYDYKNASMQRLLSRPRVLLVPLLLASLVAALVAWFLANYLARPIVLLRQAMKRFAEGQVHESVAAKLGSRRDDLVDLAHNLDDMVVQWLRILAAQKNLLRDVSHDLRSPLTRAQLALSLLRQSPHAAKEDQARYLMRVETELERLNQLIARVLLYAKLDSGFIKLHAQPFDWLAMLNRLLDDARFEASNKGIHLDFQQPTLTENVQALMRYVGDEWLWQGAVENVLGNALRFAPQGSTVHVQLSALPKTETTPLQYRLTIADEGCGVDEALLMHLFDPFFRVEKSRMQQDLSGGASHAGHDGLGLAITQRAVVFHQGTVRAYNRKPKQGEMAKGTTGLVIEMVWPAKMA